MPAERPDGSVVADFEVDPAEWSGRGAGDDGAGSRFEVPFVAGAVPALLVGLVVDDAAEVGALLAERDDVGVAELTKIAGSSPPG